MRLAALTLEQCEQVRLWRNDALYALRTPYAKTKEQQAKFYENVVNGEDARSHYWAVMNGGNSHHVGDADSAFVGMVGLENIQWENSIGEISIMIDPALRGKHKGAEAIQLLLDQGFNYMGLQEIFGECYVSNPAIRFWQGIVKRYNGKIATLPRRKLWNGTRFDSMYFSISKEAFNEQNRT